MSESFDELLSRHFRENTRQILDTTREMIQESRKEILQDTRGMIEESREQTLQETRGMIQESREETLQETRGMIQESREETLQETRELVREMVQDSEHRMTILLEDIRGDVRAIAEGVETNRQRFDRLRTEDRRDIDDLDVRVTHLEARASTG